MINGELVNGARKECGNPSTTLNVYLMLSLGILNVVSILSIEGMCMVALAHAVMIISGSTFQPLLITLSISALCFYIFRIIISSCILSLQYVNLMNCIVRLSLGFVGDGD